MPMDRGSLFPFGEWLPDQPVYRPGRDAGLSAIENAFPRTDGYYGPARSLASTDVNDMSTASAEPFVQPTWVGGVAARRGSTVGVDTYAGTSGETRRLFHYDESARTWVDASRPAGYQGAAFGPMPWFFANFGERTIAASGFLPPQITDAGDSKQFNDLGGTPPDAFGVAVVRNFVVLFGTRHPTFSGLTDFNWLRLWWSAIENAEDWPEPRTQEAISKRSDFQELQEGGRLMNVVPGVGGSDACVFSERKIWRMNFQSDVTFRFDIAEADQGAASPHSVVPVNEAAFFLGLDGFYLFDGANSSPIDKGRVYGFFRERVLNGSPPSNSLLVTAGADTARSLVFWSYLTDRGDGENTFNNNLLIYNYASQLWGHAIISVDALGRVSSDVERLDKPRLIAVGRDFKASTFTGPSLETTLEPHEIARGDGQRIFLGRIQPHIDAADVRVSVRGRDTQGGVATMTPEVRLEPDGMAPIFNRARFFRPRFRIPAATDWNSAVGFEIYNVETGQQKATFPTRLTRRM